MHNYKELIVWQKAMDLVARVYELTRDFPKAELFGLISQLRRAAVSIALNIAEGAVVIAIWDLRDSWTSPCVQHTKL